MTVRKVIRFLPEDFEIEESLRDQLSSRSGTQRFLAGDHEALLIVHEVPEPKIPERDALVFWRRADGTWRGPADSEGLKEMSRLFDRYQSVIDKYEALLEETEEVTQVFEIIRHAAPIARSMRNMLAALEAAVPADEENRTLIGLRDRVREMQRAAELLYHDSKLTLEFWQAESAEEHQQAAERLNSIAFRLNLMAGFFLPLVAVAGLLGMNVEIPGFLQPGFWVILGAGLLLGAIVLFVVGWEGLRRKK
ncbi:CorA family divalent cation transporter [Haloferula sp. A504]|uniref:CorA family divalent cation transporter n=1 Tax=Haloferula sp. A504 TaxID=3373601 RepID=UPI0031BE96A8|nr:hypothetical protein [Verrucomicrobiaceae bacterium E54]